MSLQIKTLKYAGENKADNQMEIFFVPLVYADEFPTLQQSIIEQTPKWENLALEMLSNMHTITIYFN